MFFDTHSHLDLAKYDGDRQEVLARARMAGVREMIVIGLGKAGSQSAVALAEREEGLYATVGLHPHDAEQADESLFEAMRAHARHPKVAAFGEMGLDFYREYAPRDAQHRVFERQLTLARELAMPVVLHVRDAEEEVLGMIEQFFPKARPLARPAGIWHCFSGRAEHAQRAIERGFLISIAGQLTYKKNDALRAAVRSIAIEHCLIETDCPWLSPQALRGRRNEPSFITHTARALAELHGLCVEDVARITTGNARRVFGLSGAHPRGPALKGGPTIAYRIRNALYVNLTWRCNARCVFCPREDAPFVKGHDLYLDPTREPDLAAVEAAVAAERALREPDEIVFCGFGEPTLRLAELIALGRSFRAQGLCVRLNTHDGAQYEKMMRAVHGPGAWQAMLDFVRAARHAGLETHVTALEGFPGVDGERCRALADELGATFRSRRYEELG